MIAFALAAALLTATAPAPVTLSTIEGEHLRIVSATDSTAMTAMTLDTPVSWDLEVSADAAGTIDLWLRASGDTNAYAVTVTACDGVFQPAAPCTGTTLSTEPVEAGERVSLGTQDEAPHWYRVDVTLLQDAPAAVAVELHASGLGEELSTSPQPPRKPEPQPGTLPRTGAIAASSAAACGIALLSLGACTLVAARRRRMS